MVGLLKFDFINSRNLEYDDSCNLQVDCYVK